MVQSTTENQGTKVEPSMSAIGYIIAAGIAIFLSPLIPIIAVVFLAQKLQAKNESMKRA